MKKMYVLFGVITALLLSTVSVYADVISPVRAAARLLPVILIIAFAVIFIVIIFRRKKK